MHLYKAAWIVAWSFLFAASIGAQTPPSLRFEHLRTEEGLSQNTVQGLLQDRRGFMWIGTYDGLNRYDGHRVTIYTPTPGDSTTIGGRLIWTMDEAPDGQLWFGTNEGGLNRYDPATEAFTRYGIDAPPPRRICSDKIYKVHVGSDGILWLGTQQNGLCRFNPATGALRTYMHDPDDPRSLDDNTVIAILEDRRGVIWVGTSSGLNRLNPETGTFDHFSHDPGDPQTLTHEHIETLFEDRAGRLWIGTFEGLNRWDPETDAFERIRVPDSPAGAQFEDALIARIREERPGVLWIATNGRGLFRFNVEERTLTQHRQHPTDPGSLGSDDLLSMTVDGGGVLWVGTAGAGVDWMPPQVRQFSRYRADPADPSSLSSNIVRSIGETPDGAIWLGLTVGLDRFDPETGAFRHYGSEAANTNSLSGRWVRDLAADSSGALWIAVNGGGLDRLDPATDTFRHYRAGPGGLTSDRVISVTTDRRGHVWAGTYEGLNRLNPKTGDVTHYRADPDNPQRLGNSIVLSLYEDRDGFIWVGTRGGGLHRLDPATGRFTRYTHDPDDPRSLSHDHVTGIHEDRDGFIWVGTHGGGLNRLDPATGAFTHYTTADGLPNDVVHGVLEDESERLWLSTNRGLARLNPDTEEVTVYTRSDGLTGDEFNAGAYHRSASGRMYFGGVTGFSAFRPDDVEQNRPIPPVTLTSLDVRGAATTRPIALSVAEEVRLDHDENFFTLRFAVLDFAAPAQNRYAYRLEGYDAGWVEVGNRPSAIYTDVPPGRYQFSVRGAGSDGVWGEPARVAVVVEPAYWQTWWFRLLVAGLLVGLLLAAYRYRVYHIRKVESTRRRIARDLHDDLGSRISTLALRTDLISRRRHLAPSDRDYLTDLARETRETVDDLRHLVWLVDTGTDSLRALLERIEDVASQMLADHAHRVEVPEEDVPDVTLDAETRRHVLMICKEALHNAIRHSGAKRIDVSAVLNERTLHVCVADDGRGFEQNGRPDGGHGLISMRERAEALGGGLRVESAPGEGTVVQFATNIM